MRCSLFRWYTLAALVLGMAQAGLSADIDEFKVKRQEVFEFTERPTANRDGDRISISFASKGYCDATVAIEDGNGKIVRHLVSGVLGPNAPAPFQKSSLTQTVVWDCKNDQGKYLDRLDRYTVRVSLGLKPQFERTLYWSPHKRIANLAPVLAATPQGVLVFEGLGVDHVRLFDRAGAYLRTVYPSPANKVGQVVGMQTRTFPQDGQSLPLKQGYQLATLLTCGSSARSALGDTIFGGFAATAMAVNKDRIALAFHDLNRLAMDGTSGGLPLTGPKVSYVVKIGARDEVVGPTSMAFSPDGKYLYMTGYVWKVDYWFDTANAYHVVKRMEYARPDAPVVFAGVEKADGGYGAGNDRFCGPLGVECDPQGRVYVADFGNSRIQVFSPEGKHLKTIATPHPAVVKIDPNSGEIWAFSWPAMGLSNEVCRERQVAPGNFKPTVSRLGTFDKPVAGQPQPLPAIEASGFGGWTTSGGQIHQVAVDFADPATLWIVGRKPTVGLAEANWAGGGMGSMVGEWGNRGIKMFRLTEGKWTLCGDFAAMAREKVQRITPSSFSRQRLYVSPADEMLYVCEEQTGAGKSFYTMLQINPATGRIRELKLPFDPEDICFGIDGLIYMCTDREVLRYDPVNWREVPWDYGEERLRVGFASSGDIPRANPISALPIPGTRPVWWHSTGMWISPKGHLAVVCNIVEKPPPRRGDKDRYVTPGIGKAFTPTVYPGRAGNRVIQIFDSHGKLMHEDAAPGMTNGDGVGIDNEGNLYVMVAAPRVIDGKTYFDGTSETLMKFAPGKVKFLSSGDAPVPLSDDLKPKRPADIVKGGLTWAEGAQWLYGGVGYGGQGGSCVCWHARFQLDYFARSFAPEVLRFNVAVLDSSGNLILRIGKYGNVDDGAPAISDGGPAKAQSIGGDEVALFHAAYVGVHTDRRLFIHDAGNGRIVSVKLDYHATERVPLQVR